MAWRSVFLLLHVLRLVISKNVVVKHLRSMTSPETEYQNLPLGGRFRVDLTTVEEEPAKQRTLTFDFDEDADNQIDTLGYLFASQSLQRIYTRSNAGTRFEVWGTGVELDTQRPTTLEFDLTTRGLQVYVDQNRTPWFDFENFQQVPTKIDKIRVGSGVAATAGEIADRVCRTECRAGVECNLEDSPNQRPCDGTCHWWSPEMCGKNGDSDAAQGFCCTGMIDTLSMKRAEVGSVFRSLSDSEMTPAERDRACQASRFDPAYGDCFSNAEAKFPKLRVTEKSPSGETKYEAQLTALPDGTADVIKVSPWAVASDVPVEHLISYITKGDDDFGLTVDSIGVVTGVSGEPSASLGVKVGWWAWALITEDDTRQWTQARMQAVFRDKFPFAILFLDVRPPLEHPPNCTEDETWEANGRKCQAFTDRKYCTVWGLETEAWDGDGGLQDQKDDKGESVLDACCACGGGTLPVRAVPTLPPTPAPTPVPPPTPPPTQAPPEGAEKLVCPKCFEGDDRTEIMGGRVWYTVENADFESLTDVNLHSTFVEKVKSVVVAAFQASVGAVNVSKSNWIALDKGSVVIDAVVWHPEDDTKAGAIKAVLANTSLSAKFADELSSDLTDVIDGYPIVALRSGPIDVRIIQSDDTTREPGSIIPGIDDSLLPVIAAVAVVIVGLLLWLAARHCSGNRSADIMNRRLDLPTGYSKDTFVNLEPPRDAVPAHSPFVQEEKPPEAKKYRTRNRKNREANTSQSAEIELVEPPEEPVERDEPVPKRRDGSRVDATLSDASNASSADEKSGKKKGTSSRQRRYKPTERPRNRDRD